MKTKWIALIVLLASLVSMRAATNGLTALLQQGLFEEEANHNLEAAMQAYQSAIAEHDKDRKLVATAVFRLGECYRKQGKTNEASAQYQRVLREFPEQEALVKLSKDNLGQHKTADLAELALPSVTTSEEDEEVRNIKAMIQNSPDLIDAVTTDNKTPLQIAAEKGHLKTAEYLLANGANVNNAPRGSVPLYLAALNGRKAMVELLLAHGAKVENSGALYEAASHGFKGVAEVLIAAKEDVNEIGHNTGKRRPLHAAGQNESQTIVEMLITNKADVNAKDSEDRTPLHLTRNMAIARLLIANGAQVNAKDSHGQTPLFTAIFSDRAELLKLLLDSGADVEVNRDNWTKNSGTSGASTPLGQAISDGRAAIVEMLLKSHAKPNAKFGCSYPSIDRRGETALITAIRLAKPEIVNLLLAYGADPNLKSDSGDIPVVVAVNYNRKEIVQSLINFKAKLDITVQNRPLLCWTVWPGSASLVELLCQNGLNPNERDPEGGSPLHAAVQSLASDVVEVLIAQGADVNALNNEGKPPLAYTRPVSGTGTWDDTRIAKGAAIAEILRKAGANENYERLTKIWVRQQGQSTSQWVFYKGTNLFNRFSLVELIGYFYTPPDRSGTSTKVTFPDFSKIVINRLKPDGTTNSIPVDLIGILQTDDRSKDVWLQWGDIVEIPQEDHKVDERWAGLTEPVRRALQKTMQRQVKVVIKGGTNTVAILPSYGFPEVPEIGGRPKPLLDCYSLKEVLRNSNLLLISSDLSRVHVKRANPVGDEPSEMVLDETKGQNPDLWLRDGDVIEVPERDPSSGVTIDVGDGGLPPVQPTRVVRPNPPGRQ